MLLFRVTRLLVLDLVDDAPVVLHVKVAGGHGHLELGLQRLVLHLLVNRALQ